MPTFDVDTGIEAALYMVRKREDTLRSLRDRQDFDLGIYLLHDPYQEKKPLSQRAFISNEPMNAADTAHSILTKNEIRWQIALEEKEQPREDERRLMSRFERLMAGIMADFDEQSVMAMGDLVRKEIAWDALLRGWIADKVVGSNAENRDNPMVHVRYDPRFVTPWWNGRQLSRVVARSMIDVDEAEEYLMASGRKDLIDVSRFRDYAMEHPIWKYEYWDLEFTGTFIEFAYEAHGHNYGGYWATEPYEHGMMNTIKRLPWYIAPVNGLPFDKKPAASKEGLMDPRREDFERSIGMVKRTWRTTEDTWAERGRSIFASVEETYAQFNEVVATIFQNFSLDTFGTWFITTRTGELPEGVQENLGGPVAIGLKEGETAQRLSPIPANQDGMRMFEILSNERESGLIRQVLAGAVAGERMSGFLHSRQEGMALNALEPWITAMNQWASSVGQRVFDQLYFDRGLNRKFEVAVADARERTFSILEFDPKELRRNKRRLRIRGMIEPSVPQDLVERLTAANLARQGGTPLLSRRTIYDKLLPTLVNDPDAETDRVWEDLADTEPTTILLRMAKAYESMGDMEMAAWYRDRGNQRMLIEIMQLQQLTSMVRGGGPTQGNFAGPPTPPSSVQPPEMRGEGREQQIA